MFYRLADARLVPVTKRLHSDVSGFSLSADGRLLAVRADVDGRKDLLFFDGDSFDELPSPQLPSGSVIAAQFHPQLPLLAFALNGSKGPSQVGTLDPVGGATEPWTRPSSRRRHRPEPVRRAADRSLEELRRPRDLRDRSTCRRRASPASGRCSSRSTAGRNRRREFGFIGRYNYFVERARHRPDPAERARLARLRQDVPVARRRHEARGLGEGHRRPARLDRAQPDLDASRVHGERRQLRRLHEPGRRDALRRSDRRLDRRRRHLELRDLPASTPRATGATCAAPSTATSATRRCASS